MSGCGVIAFLIFLITGGVLGISQMTPSRPAFTFWTDRTVIPAGGCVALSWRAPEASYVIMNGSNWPEGEHMEAESIGATTVCPSAAERYVPDEPVIYTLTAVYPDGVRETLSLTITYEGVLPTVFSPTFVPTPVVLSPTPVATPWPLAAFYQPFEHGFMLYRAGEGCVFAYSELETPGHIILDPAGQEDGRPDYCILFDELSPLLSPTPEIFTFEPFGQIWSAYPEVQAALGQPLGEPFLHSGTIPLAVEGTPYDRPIGTLPDGRTLRCSSTLETCVVE